MDDVKANRTISRFRWSARHVGSGGPPATHRASPLARSVRKASPKPQLNFQVRRRERVASGAAPQNEFLPKPSMTIPASPSHACMVPFSSRQQFHAVNFPVPSRSSQHTAASAGDLSAQGTPSFRRCPPLSETRHRRSPSVPEQAIAPLASGGRKRGRRSSRDSEKCRVR